MENFIRWTKLKIRIHIKDKDVYFREKEIWWASLGMNVGYEQNGKNENFERPILVLKKFGSGSLWALPLTSKEKIGRFYYRFDFKGKNHSVILTQLRLISSKRLLRRMGSFSGCDFNEVKRLVKNFL